MSFLPFMVNPVSPNNRDVLFRDRLGLCFGAADGCPANRGEFAIVKNVGGKFIIGENNLGVLVAIALFTTTPEL